MSTFNKLSKTDFYFPATRTRRGFQRVLYTSPKTLKTYTADIQHHIADDVKVEDEPTQEAMKRLRNIVIAIDGIF
jgi:CO dehydrogenase/acetyl-CoA synthase delta subunit